MKYGNVTLGQVEALINKLGGEDAMMRFLRGELQFAEKMLEEIVLEVDYDLSLPDAIKLGKYEWINDCIAPNRRLDKPAFVGKHECKLVLFRFGCDVSTEEAESEIKSRGLRPAGVEELLAFGAKRPEDQRKFRIIALGSSFRGDSGHECTPCLDRKGDERDLSLLWIGNYWSGSYRFLSVRK